MSPGRSPTLAYPAGIRCARLIDGKRAYPVNENAGPKGVRYGFTYRSWLYHWPGPGSRYTPAGLYPWRYPKSHGPHINSAAKAAKKVMGVLTPD
jgi:hypothetical protein